LTHKVIHIVDSLGLGGVQTLIKSFFENQKNNENIYLYSLRNCTPKIKLNHPNIYEFNSLSKVSLMPLREIISVIKKNNIEIVHCYLPRSQIFGYLVKLFIPSIKLFFHEQGSIFFTEYKYKLIDKLFRSFLTISQKKVTCFIAISEATKNKLIANAKISNNKIKIIYNAIDLDHFKYNNQRVVNQTFTVGFASRIIERKGWRTFIDAAEILKSKDNLKFIIAGTGSDQNDLQDIIEQRKLGQTVSFIGYCSNMKQFYSDISCFVIPSVWEPQGLTEIEAQAAGIPVIASNTIGLNEIIIHNYNGLLFETNNSKDLASKILELADNQHKITELVENAKISVENYSISTYVNKLNNLYDELF